MSGMGPSDGCGVLLQGRLEVLHQQFKMSVAGFRIEMAGVVKTDQWCAEFRGYFFSIRDADEGIIFGVKDQKMFRTGTNFRPVEGGAKEGEIPFMIS